MFVIERQNAILDIIKKQKSAKVSTLSKKFYVGEATIRRDLDVLEEKGLIQRTHGGAILLDGLDEEIPISVREEAESISKSKIGKLAHLLIENGHTIILDSSTTALKIVPFLKAKKLTILTNGIKTAMVLGEKHKYKVYCSGGYLRENSLSFIGKNARNFFQEFEANILFFSCRAISIEKGLTDPSQDEAELRQIMIKNCNKVVLLCDHTKFDQKSFCKIGSFKMIDYLITNKEPAKKWLDFFNKQNIKLLY